MDATRNRKNNGALDSISSCSFSQEKLANSSLLLLRNNEGFDLEHKPEISWVTCLQTSLTISFFNSGTFITADAMDLEFPNANCLPTRTYFSARFAVLSLVFGNLIVIYIMKT